MIHGMDRYGCEYHSTYFMLSSVHPLICVDAGVEGATGIAEGASEMNNELAPYLSLGGKEAPQDHQCHFPPPRSMKQVEGTTSRKEALYRWEGDTRYAHLVP